MRLVPPPPPRPALLRPALARLGALLLAVFLLPAVPVQAKKGELTHKEQDAAIAALPETYRDWVESVTFIVSDEELEAFLALEKDYQRDAFIEQFWRIRDPYPDTARNELRDRYDQLLEQARLEFGDLTDERSQIMLLNGLPDARIEIKCRDVWPTEVWYYDGTDRIGEEFLLIFYQRWGQGRWRIWRPYDGVDDLLQFAPVNMSPGAAMEAIRSSCRLEEGDALLSAIVGAMRRGDFDIDNLVARLTEPPEPASEEWVATFNTYTTDLPDDAATFDAELSVEFPGRHQSRTVVQALLAVPVSEVEATTLGGANAYNLVLTGEVLREAKLFDNFRYRFDFPAAEVRGDTLPLVFERYLRPGEYRLVLKVEDLESGAFHRLERPLVVPAVNAAEPPEPQDPTTRRLLAEANAAISTGDDTIQLVEPQGDLQTGYVRFNTLVTGREIAEVSFRLDGDEILRKKRPPYSVELDLGPLPRMRTLEAVAFDATGGEVARDELELNAGSHRFAVRLVEPRPGESYSGSLRAEAEVEVPEGESVEKVELYLNETLVATLYQEPWTHPVLLPAGNPVAYVRAVAYTPDGNSTEDVVFINAPGLIEELDVQFVELYITVTDRQGRPVAGLGVEDFRVFEDGAPQQPVRFELVKNLPIHAGIMVDVSASMEDKLDTAQRAAVGFLEDVITPRDRATLVTFNDHPHLAVKFTNELQSLAGGLAGLKAERGTALYDSLIFALYYFNGVKGQRAIILLSDGKDEASRFTFEQTLEYARRTGVALYAIGLELGRGDRAARKALEQLADETGGRSFFVDSVEELPAIYDVIQEELRSRYYLAYQSNNPAGDGEFRTIEVEVGGSGLEAKTLRGYYP